MLKTLVVTNFTVVKHLELDFNKGFSAITGETGAGKSITLDALSLCLGERADPGKIRKGEDASFITASFDISDLPRAQSALEELDFFSDDNECIIRRVVKKSGRSQAYINGHLATLSQLQILGENLASVCGQHAQYALLKSSNQRKILDQYGKHESLLHDMSNSYNLYNSKLSIYNKALAEQKQKSEKAELLTYHTQELDEFAPLEDEFPSLENEQKRLCNASELVNRANMNMQTLSEGSEGNILSNLNSLIKSLETMIVMDNSVSAVLSGVNSALLELEDSSSELQSYCDSLEVDPVRLSEVEERFAKYMELSRKHSVNPESLYEHHQELLSTLSDIHSNSEFLDSLESELEKLKETMLDAGEKLHNSRVIAASHLSKEITLKMPDLSMEKGACEVVPTVYCDKLNSIGPTGFDSVSINVSTNSGDDMGPLGKVASGGELSRISLIIQLAIAQKQTTPTLIFDEVDTGISGPTAAVVGGMLKELGTQTQVFSITHLPQVASFGHNHYYVNKTNDEGRTSTNMVLLDEEGRVMELARLLGGEKINDNAISNARELIESGAAK